MLSLQVSSLKTRARGIGLNGAKIKAQNQFFCTFFVTKCTPSASNNYINTLFSY